MTRMSTFAGPPAPREPIVTHAPSEQQQAVYDWVERENGSARVIAVAGSGKTYTLLQACKRMKGSVFYGAYNKKIADEIAGKLVAIGASHAQAKTFHAAGFAALRKVVPRTRTDGDKISDMVRSLRVPEYYQSFVTKLVSLSKQSGIGIPRICGFDQDEAYDQLVDHHDLEYNLGEQRDMAKARAEATVIAKAVLKKSIEACDQIIDFDDMIYMPLLLDLQVEQYDWVGIDEAQDTNATRRLLARKLLKPGGRAVAVGDPHQAIYGFTGADADALDLIAAEFGMIDLSLNVSYRCSKTVVAMAQQWVSHIQAAPEAPEGRVSKMSLTNFEANAGVLTYQDAILCRNTRPIVSMALSFIRRGIGCHVEGRDIGRNLVTLAKKMKRASLEEMVEALSDHVRKETAKFMAKHQEMKADQLEDKFATIVAIVDYLPPDANMFHFEASVNRLFGDDDRSTLTLSTIHKAKGREWDRVYLLGRDQYMPSKWAKQGWQKEQEINLMYVAVTRAKRELIDVFTREEVEAEIPKGEHKMLSQPSNHLIELYDALTEVPLPKAEVVEPADATVAAINTLIGFAHKDGVSIILDGHLYYKDIPQMIELLQRFVKEEIE